MPGGYSCLCIFSVEWLTALFNSIRIIDFPCLLLLPFRIMSLQRQLAQRESDLAAVRQQMSDGKELLARREGELDRLVKRLGEGPDVDRLQLTYRNEANENMILTLNAQVRRWHLETPGSTRHTHPAPPSDISCWAALHVNQLNAQISRVGPS